MKTFLLLIFLYCSVYISCKKNAAFFVPDRMNIVEYDKENMIISGHVSRINRTNFAITINFTILNDLPPITLKISTYALFSNEYRPMPLVIKKSLCDIYKLELKWVEEEIRRYSKIPQCNIKKGNYSVNNFMPHTSRFPFASPWDNVKFRLHFFFTGTERNFAVVDIMAHVDKSKTEQ